MNAFLDQIYSIRWQEGMRAKNKGEKNTKEGNLLYGEITRAGVRNLITALSPEYLNTNSVFYDIGSGVGKVVLHINEIVGCQTIGIEMSKGRVEKAKELQLLVPRKKVTFINDTFQNCDMSDATVIYIDSTVMNEKVLKQLLEKVPKGCLLISSKVIKGIEYKPLKGLYCPGKRYLSNQYETYNIHLGSTYARNMRGYCSIKE